MEGEWKAINYSLYQKNVSKNLLKKHSIVHQHSNILMFRYNSDKIHIVICEAKYSKFTCKFYFCRKIAKRYYN